MRREVAVLMLSTSLLMSACMKSGKEEFVEEGAKQLGEAEVKQAFIGNTLAGSILSTSTPIQFAVYMSPDGRTTGVAMEDNDRGTWKIKADGSVCMKWSRWQEKAETCSIYYRKGDVLKVFVPEGGVASIGKIVPGNPRKLELRTDKEIALEKGEIAAISAEEAQSLLSGNTLSGALKQLSNSPYDAYYDASGKLAGKVNGYVKDSDKGSWSIKPSGEVCLKWSKWNDGAESCAPLYRSGKSISSFTPEGSLTMVATTRKGNAAKLEL